jgi:hypothetical protein
MSVVVQVGELVTPLGDDTQGILEEGDDDEESANRRDITSSKYQQLEVPAETSYKTHGLTGCDRVSSQSSILLVCSRMASSGLGSLVASCPEPPKDVGCEPRWYPAVPLI